MRLRNVKPGFGTLPLVVFLLTVVSFGEALVEAATLKVPGSYATIQAAIDAASAGDTIKISSGTFTENIVIDKKLRIRGKSKTRLVAADGGEPTVTIAADGVELKRLDIRDGSIGVTADSVNNLKLLSLRVHDANGDGIVLVSAEDALLSKCRVYDNGENGITLEGGKDCTIKKCRTYGNGYSGVLLTDQIVISNRNPDTESFTETAVPGIGHKVESCRSYENFIGINVIGGEDIGLVKNRCSRNYEGASVSGFVDSTSTLNILVESNLFSDNEGSGFFVSESQGIARNNVSKNNKGSGFFASFGDYVSTNWVYENNTAEGNDGGGFGVFTNESRFVGNKSINNQSFGFHFNGTAGEGGPGTTQAVDNLASGNGSHGFFIEGHRLNILGEHAMENNRSVSNGGDGFHYRAEDGWPTLPSLFQDNFADENAGYGFVDNNSSNSYEGNECGGNNAAGPSNPVGLCDE